MPKELYNEGRIVGYSSYEHYVNNALAENPDQEIASERQWLSNSLGSGISMIIKIKASDFESENGACVREYVIPENSYIRAANTIVGTLFYGECEVDEIGWATKVIDYGELLSNTESSSPDTTDDATTYPISNKLSEFLSNSTNKVLGWFTPKPDKYSDGVRNKINNILNAIYGTRDQGGNNPGVDGKVRGSITLHEGFEVSDQIQVASQYLKIQEGIVLQPGIWNVTETKSPYKDLMANLKDEPVLRLSFNNKVTKDFYILLTGFSDFKVLYGITGIDGSCDIETSSNSGDFLGPSVFPWGAKVTFDYPSNIQEYIRKGIYSRYDNLSVNYNDNTLTTELVASYIRAGKGISIFGPIKPGADITVTSQIKTNTASITTGSSDATGSTMSCEGSTHSYLKLSQRSYETTTNEGIRPDDDVTTIINHAEVIPGDGIAFRPPVGDRGTIGISSIIDVDPNKMLYVDQNSSDDDTQITTRIKASKPVSTKASGVKITGPNTNGGDVDFKSRMIVRSTNSENSVSYRGSEPPNNISDVGGIDIVVPSQNATDAYRGYSYNPYLMIIQRDNKTVFVPAEFQGENGLEVTTVPVVNNSKELEQFALNNKNDLSIPDKDIYSAPLINLKIDTSSIKFGDGKNPNAQDLEEILRMIIDRLQGTFNNGYLQWNYDKGYKAAIGNMNVFSSESLDDGPCIIARPRTKNNQDITGIGDLKVK